MHYEALIITYPRLNRAPQRLDISVSSGHLFCSMSPVHNNQTLPSWKLEPLKVQVSPVLVLFVTPLSLNEAAFNSFIFCLMIHTLVLCPFFQSLFISHFTSSSSSPKFSCIPPIPLSKPFYHAEAACCFLCETRSPPFTEKCSLSHEYTVLIAST